MDHYHMDFVDYRRYHRMFEKADLGDVDQMLKYDLIIFMNIILETYGQTKAAKMERDQSLVENDSLLRVLVFSNPKKVLDYGVNSINMPMIRVNVVKTLWFQNRSIILFEQAQRAHSNSVNGLVIFCHFEKI